KEQWRTLIFSRAVMTSLCHGPKSQCATIRLSCCRSAYPQPATPSRGGLSRHREASHARSNLIPICVPRILEIWHHFAERRTSPCSPKVFARQGLGTDPS